MIETSKKTIAFAAALSLLSSPALATRSADVTTAGSPAAQGVIPSNADGALPVPQQWNCDRIRPEYNTWLQSGNKKEDWRYAGKTYRAVDTGEVYNWGDWLRWAKAEKCAGFAPADNSRLLIGGGIFAAGMTLLLTAFGKGADSPG